MCFAHKITWSECSWGLAEGLRISVITVKRGFVWKRKVWIVSLVKGAESVSYYRFRQKPDISLHTTEEEIQTAVKEKGENITRDEAEQLLQCSR